MRTPTHVCARQVARLQEALGNTQLGVTVNNRVTHPLNGRIVTSYAAPHTEPPRLRSSTLTAAAVVACVACLLSAGCMLRSRSRTASQSHASARRTAGQSSGTSTGRSGARSDGDGVMLSAGRCVAMDGTDGGYDVRPIPACPSAQMAVSAFMETNTLPPPSSGPSSPPVAVPLV